MEEIARQLKRIEDRLDQLEALSRIRYGKGSWTPAFTGSTTAGTFTYDATLTGGQYTRIGNRVLFNGRIRITTITVAPAGALRITGLPFTTANAAIQTAGAAAVAVYQGITLTAGYTQIGLQVSANDTFIAITQSGSGVAQANIQGSALALVSGVANIVFEGHYWVE